MPKHRHFLYCLAASCSLLLISETSSAQSTEGAIESLRSEGIKLSLTKAALIKKKLILQFVATNATKQRVYIRNALLEESQRPFLATGIRLSPPEVSGMEFCSSNASACAMDAYSGGDDSTRYSYIDPGNKIAFQFAYDAITYDTTALSNEHHFVSFTATFLLKFANQNSVLQREPAKIARFNFSNTLFTTP